LSANYKASFVRFKGVCLKRVVECRISLSFGNSVFLLEIGMPGPLRKEGKQQGNAVKFRLLVRTELLRLY